MFDYRVYMYSLEQIVCLFPVCIHVHMSARYIKIALINLIFMFSLWGIDWVGSLYANRIFMYFCIKNNIGTQGEVC